MTSIDPAQTRLVQELKHSSPLLGCRFSPCGRFVFAGGQDNSVQRWQLDGAKKTTLSGHKSWIRALAFAAKQGLLFSADYSGKLLTWSVEAETPAPLRTTAAHKGFVRALAVSPDGKLLASCGNDQLIRLWNVADGTALKEFAGHASHVYNVAFHPTQPLLVSGDLKGAIKIWDLAMGTVEREFDGKVLHKYDTTFEADHGGVRSMAFNGDGSLLACAGITDVSNAFAGIGKPVVVLFNWATGKQKFLLRPRENFQGTMWGVVQFPTGQIAACAGGNGGMLWYWKPDAAADTFALKLPNNARDLALHPDGQRLAIAFFDGAVRIYDAGSPNRK